MRRPPTPFRVVQSGLLSLLGCLALSGCGPRMAQPEVLFVSVGTNLDQSMSSFGLAELQADMAFLTRGYNRIEPQTIFQVSFYPNEELLPVISQRSRAALGPDLLLLNGDASNLLLKAGLVQPFPASRDELNRFSPITVRRLRNAKGQLAGLPAYVVTQLACFNTREIQTPPATLKQLLAVSADGHQVGLSLLATDLFWTAGAQGAIPGLKQAISRQQPTPQQRAAIEAWLAWLQNASNQHGITFYSDQIAAERQLAKGQLDWLPCHSTSLRRLRRSMGATLGVSPLPSGPGGDPNPLNRLRVWALGAHTDAWARERAIRFVRFSTNPLVQRELTVSTQAVLPTNRFVEVPEMSSAVLASMVKASKQGEQNAQLINMLETNDPRIAITQRLVTELVFGQLTPGVATRQLIDTLSHKP